MYGSSQFLIELLGLMGLIVYSNDVVGGGRTSCCVQTGALVHIVVTMPWLSPRTCRSTAHYGGTTAMTATGGFWRVSRRQACIAWWCCFFAFLLILLCFSCLHCNWWLEEQNLKWQHSGTSLLAQDRWSHRRQQQLHASENGESKRRMIDFWVWIVIRYRFWGRMFGISMPFEWDVTWFSA